MQVQTYEKCIDKFNQLSRNIAIVQKAYQKTDDKRISLGIRYLLFYKYELLITILNNKELYKLWRKGVNEHSLCVILNKNVPMKQRLKAFLIWIHLFPLKNRISR